MHIQQHTEEEAMIAIEMAIDEGLYVTISDKQKDTMGYILDVELHRQMTPSMVCREVNMKLSNNGKSIYIDMFNYIDEVCFHGCVDNKL